MPTVNLGWVIKIGRVLWCLLQKKVKLSTIICQLKFINIFPLSGNHSSTIDRSHFIFSGVPSQLSSFPPYQQNKNCESLKEVITMQNNLQVFFITKGYRKHSKNCATASSFKTYDNGPVTAINSEIMYVRDIHHILRLFTGNQSQILHCSFCYDCKN